MTVPPPRCYTGPHILTKSTRSYLACSPGGVSSSMRTLPVVMSTTRKCERCLHGDSSSNAQSSPVVLAAGRRHKRGETMQEVVVDELDINHCGRRQGLVDQRTILAACFFSSFHITVHFQRGTTRQQNTHSFGYGHQLMALWITYPATIDQSSSRMNSC